jgi:hypothetical protein
VTRHPVFISWSGETSKKVAVSEFLSDLFAQVQTFMSDQDIPKGTRWNPEITSKLAEVHFGVVCLTPHNIPAPWLLFESGAISNLPGARLFTLLHGLSYHQIPYPLAMFNHATTERDEVRKVVCSLNTALAEDGLAASRLTKAFRRWWPELAGTLSKLAPAAEIKAAPHSYERENHRLLTEMVTMVRDAVRTSESGRLDFGHPEDIAELRGYVRTI